MILFYGHGYILESGLKLLVNVVAFLFKVGAKLEIEVDNGWVSLVLPIIGVTLTNIDVNVSCRSIMDDFKGDPLVFHAVDECGSAGVPVQIAVLVIQHGRGS